jgi:hypothetical protein
MTLHEPATFATDCLLAAWSCWLGSRLKAAHPATSWWRRTFFWTAAAGLAGGIYHGFGPSMPAGAAEWLWRATLIAISITSLCLTLAAIHTNLKQRLFAWTAFAIGKAIVCIGYSMTHPVFLSAIVDYGSAMLLVLGLELNSWRTQGAAHAKWIVAGIAASVAGAVVQQLHWAPHPQFNHNDLYHLIQMLALALFYRGARTLT